MAIRKRELRYLNLKIDDKRSPDKWSEMARAKLASHLILSGKGIKDFDRVPDRSHLNYGFYQEDEVRNLLREVGFLGVRGDERKHLEIEVQAAASCSCLWLFGCYAP